MENKVHMCYFIILNFKILHNRLSNLSRQTILRNYSQVSFTYAFINFLSELEIFKMIKSNYCICCLWSVVCRSVKLFGDGSATRWLLSRSTIHVLDAIYQDVLFFKTKYKCFGLLLALDVRPANFVDDLGIAFVDDWMVELRINWRSCFSLTQGGACSHLSCICL